MDKFPISKRESGWLIPLIAIFISIPFLPYQILRLSDFLLVRIALLFSLIAMAYVSPLVAIAGFVVVAFLFIQRNKVKMVALQQAMQQSTEESPAIASIETPETAPIQPAFETPAVESYKFVPSDDSGDNTFHAIAESMNEKVVLPTETVDGSDRAIQQLYRWVNPELAQQP